MFRYKIIIEYDGTNYLGWQKQKDGPSIAAALEEAVFNLSREKTEIIASGRTDAGVHAIAQTAHFDLIKDLEAPRLLIGLNHYLLNSDIAIIDCARIEENFHSRFDAKMRHYQYKILNRRARPALLKNRAWHIPEPLDIQKMNAAAKRLIGKHDFSSFRDAQCQALSPIKTLDLITITTENNLITITVSALSFLHHMVRNITGTLAWVGLGKIAATDMEKILAAKDRKKSGPNAPPCGLYFYKVDY